MPAVEVAYVRNNVILDRTLSDINGDYRLTVGSGKGELYIFAPTGSMVEGDARIAVDLTGRDELDMGRTRLTPVPAIEGLVQDRDGKPVEGALISSVELDPRLWTISDAAGRFIIELENVSLEKRLSLTAEHPLRLQRKDISTRVAKGRGQEITLERYQPEEEVTREDYRFSNLKSQLDQWENLETLLDEPAPPWDCSEWWNSAPLAVEDLRGKVVVVTFWGGFASLGPGRFRIEELKWLHRMLGNLSDVAIVGIHDNSLDAMDVEGYIEEFGIDFPVGRDTEPSVTFSRYKTVIIPQTMLIDKKGKVRYYDVDGRLLDLIKVLRRE